MLFQCCSDFWVRLKIWFNCPIVIPHHHAHCPMFQKCFPWLTGAAPNGIKIHLLIQFNPLIIMLHCYCPLPWFSFVMAWISAASQKYSGDTLPNQLLYNCAREAEMNITETCTPHVSDALGKKWVHIWMVESEKWHFGRFWVWGGFAKMNMVIYFVSLYTSLNGS